jgi:uncharacterized membrane protein
MAATFYLLNVVLGALGFAVAYYIWRHKNRGGTLVCPLGSDCEAVVHSRYSSFLGPANELLGMVYYALVGLGYLLAIFFPLVFTHSIFTSGLAVAAAGAAAGSIFLIYVQAYKIREWCTWCLVSSLLAILIFLSVIGSLFV